MIDSVLVLDDFLDQPDEYAWEALGGDFHTYVFPTATFHGIQNHPLDNPVCREIVRNFPHLVPNLSFVRKSPSGQVEPQFIHTDADMGEWSGILYLTREPDKGDGTTFWTHKATGDIKEPVPHLRTDEGRSPDAKGWVKRMTVEAKFNRLLLFPSEYFHSRALFCNYGSGTGARLVQVTFGVHAGTNRVYTMGIPTEVRVTE